MEYIPLALMSALLIFLLSRFHPAKTQEIEKGLFAVHIPMVNFYAYETSAGIVLFDTGTDPDLAKSGLKKLGLSPENVAHIFLTHTDFDHVGGLAAFPDAKVYMSDAEEQMINGQTARQVFLHNKLKGAKNGHPRAYQTLQDGEQIAVGDSAIQLRLTPGHTPGSSCYSIDGRIYISGDLLRITSKGELKPFTFLMNMNHRQDSESLEASRSAIESSQYILSGHSGFRKLR